MSKIISMRQNRSIKKLEQIKLLRNEKKELKEKKIIAKQYREINNLKRVPNGFYKQSLNEIKNTYFKKFNSDIKNFNKNTLKNNKIQNFFNNPIVNDSITINRNNYNQYQKYLKFSNDYHLLSFNGFEYKTINHFTNNHNQITTVPNHGSDYDIEYELINQDIKSFTLTWIDRKTRLAGAFFPFYLKEIFKNDLSKYY